MTRRARRRLLAGVVLALLTGVVAPVSGLLVAPVGATPAVAGTATAALAKAPSNAPLGVSIRQLTPSAIPVRGTVAVTVSGTVTNRSEETWTNLSAYLLTSESPMTTSGELAQAVQTDETAAVGSRVVETGLFVRVPDLAPGASARYTLSVPRARLGISGEPGVYWVGVHVLGSGADGAIDDVADGRARTFMPLMAAGTPTTRLALSLPVRGAVRRDATGGLRQPDRWQAMLSPHGRLDRLVRLGGTATSPISWLVDPAVVEAAQSLAGGPALLSGPAGRGTTGGTTGPSTGTSPTDGSTSTGSAGSTSSTSPAADSSPSTTASPPPAGTTSPSAPTSTTTPGVSSAAPPEAVRTAQEWLGELGTAVQGGQVMALPYGDLDVAATLGGRFDRLYAPAVSTGHDVFRRVGIPELPVVSPASGRLPADALTKLPSDSTVLLADSALPQETGSVVGGPSTTSIVLTDTGAAQGGPGPNRRMSAMAVRQRILSEAALHATSPESNEPLVVSLPRFWDPGAHWQQSAFFTGLDTSWLDLVDLPSISQAPAHRSPPASGRLGDSVGSAAAEVDPVYPDALRRREVPLANLLGSAQLRRSANVYANLVGRRRPVAEGLTKLSLLGISVDARRKPDRALRRVRASSLYVRGQMSLVRVEGPSFVMMSSDHGPIQVSLVNGLDVPVRVGVATQTSSDSVRITAPEPVELGPGQRTSLRLKSASSDIGVHSVSLIATNAEGAPLGSRTQLTVRTSQVGQVIWVVMAVGGIGLFGAIVIRLVRRVSRHRKRHGPRLRTAR